MCPSKYLPWRLYLHKVCIFNVKTEQNLATELGRQETVLAAHEHPAEAAVPLRVPPQSRPCSTLPGAPPSLLAAARAACTRGGSRAPLVHPVAQTCVVCASSVTLVSLHCICARRSRYNLFKVPPVSSYVAPCGSLLVPGGHATVLRLSFVLECSWTAPRLILFPHTTTDSLDKFIFFSFRMFLSFIYLVRRDRKCQVGSKG